MARPIRWISFSVALAGCAASTLAPLEATHPASPQAAEAPVPAPSTTLAQDASDPQREAAAPKRGKPERRGSAVVYTCPMHPEVRQAKPGRCPKCNMTLVRADQTHAH